MNPFAPVWITVLSVVVAASVGRAAEEKTAAKEDKRSLRVISSPSRESRAVIAGGERREKVEMETVTFLGIETAPVTTTTSVQLGLPRGTGLVVNHVVPESAANGVLVEHDILLKFDDQILIETRQLSVLIRSRKEGEEVMLTYLRGGQKATAKLKLGKTEMPKVTAGNSPVAFPFGLVTSPERFEYSTSKSGSEESRAEVDGVLSLMRRRASGEPMRVQIDRSQGPGFRAMTMHADSTMVLTDDEGSLELTAKEGVKTLVARNSAGENVFSGPVNTPEERKNMPAEVRTRLERLEGMHDITFRTDGDFRGAEMKVMRPRGIAYPFSRLTPFQPSAVFY